MERGIILFFILFSLISCSHEKKETHQKTIIVKEEKLQHHIYYSGIIQPIKTFVITSPEEGIVESMDFHYGDLVESDQLLFTIHSEKFQSEYKTALMQYIKSKTELNQSRSQLSEAKFLYEHQLISDDDFKAKQISFYTSQLSFIQAEDVLGGMLKQLDVKGLPLYSLTIEDIDKINQALHAKDGSQKMRILASHSGVALIPVKNETEEVATKKISIGNEVKKGDVLAMIGDVSGFTIHVNVNELNINQLKIGQAVKVSGTAFPQIILEGKIASIDRQAQSHAGSLPIFPVEIVIPFITEKERNKIHIGMSAKIDVMIESPPAITVPIAAIFLKNGEPHVKIEKDREVMDVPVKTGVTTASSVVIESSLRVGDKVVMPKVS